MPERMSRASSAGSFHASANHGRTPQPVQPAPDPTQLELDQSLPLEWEEDISQLPAWEE